MSLKKKICIVSKSYWGQLQGGAEYQLHLLANELTKRGYSLYYIYVDQGIVVQDDEMTLAPIKAGVISRKFLYPYQAVTCRHLQRELRKIGPDVIINRRGDALTGGCAYYAKSAKCKMIWHIADEPDVVPYRLRWGRNLIMEFVDKKFLEYGIRNTDLIIGQAEYQSTLLQRHYGRSCDKIVANFHPGPEEEIIKSERVTVIWIANIKEKKNPDIFLRLAKRFEANEDYEFLMVGKEGSSSLQQRIISQSEESANFEYTGALPQSEVNLLLSKSHIFVNTSSYEGFPNTFIQAWMRRLPVVSLYVDPDDVLVKHQVGYHSRDFETLVSDVERLASNKDLLEAYGRRAQQYAAETHSMKSNIDKVVTLIEQPYGRETGA